MFEERLKLLRKERGMTQIDLANALEVSGGTVAMWETGKRKPGVDMLKKLSELFDKQIDYILGSSDDPSPAKVDEDATRVSGQWVVKDEYEDVFRKFAILDDYGQKAVEAVLRVEFARCQEQGSLKSGTGISVSIKTRIVQDPVNTELPE